MAVPSKYQAKEVLNKVLNTAEDALNVDLADSVTVTVDSEFPDAATIADNFANPDTTSVMSMLMGFDGSTWDRVTVGDGTAATALRVTISTNDSHFGAVGVAADVDGVIHGQLRYIGAGVDTVETSANAIQTAVEAVNESDEGTISATTQRVTIATDDDGVAHLATIAGDTTSIQAAVEAMDDWDESDRAKVNLIAGQAGITANAGAAAANTPRVTLASDDPAVVSLDEIEGAVETIETAIKAEDASHSDGDTGIMALAVRNDVLEGLAGSDGEYSALQVNKTGALNVTETVGHLGAFYESSTTSNSGLKIVAIQFLEDTKFSLLTPATSDYIGNTGSGGDDIAAGDVFPQGMTIFGRWTAFQLVSGGRVIAYNGDW
jgi:hypothetical protein